MAHPLKKARIFSVSGTGTPRLTTVSEQESPKEKQPAEVKVMDIDVKTSEKDSEEAYTSPRVTAVIAQETPRLRILHKEGWRSPTLGDEW